VNTISDKYPALKKLNDLSESSIKEALRYFAICEQFDTYQKAVQEIRRLELENSSFLKRSVGRPRNNRLDALLFRSSIDKKKPGRPSIYTAEEKAELISRYDDLKLRLKCKTDKQLIVKLAERERFQNMSLRQKRLLVDQMRAKLKNLRDGIRRERRSGKSDK
jgi:hypothetical protein